MDLVNLKRIDVNDSANLSKIIEIIRNNNELKNTFTGGNNTLSRILNTSYAAFIMLNDQIIGFIIIVHNPKTHKDEIDMGILEKYQHKKYGTIALTRLKDIIVKNDLDIRCQVKKDNIAAIKCVLNSNFTFLEEDEEYNYYTVK